MPLTISPNMYNGGAVNLNSSPHTQFIINLMARKAARDEALDQYYQKRNSSITSEGVRSQDIPAFMDKVKNLQDFWTQNKSAIRNPTVDGGRAQMAYNNLYNEAATFPQVSKGEELKKKPFMDLLADPDKRERVTDKMISDVHTHDLPLMVKDEQGRWVDNPNRKSFDITQEKFNPKEFSTDEWQKYYKGVGEGITPNKNQIVTSRDPNDPYSNIVTTKTSYSPDQLKAIGDLAKNDYLSDDRLQYSFEKAHPFKEYKSEHPDQFDALNAIHKSVYGTDIKDDVDLHSAIVLSKKIEPSLTAKKEENFGARRHLISSQERSLAAFKKSIGLGENTTNGQATGNALDDIIDAGSKHGTFFSKDGVIYNKDGTPMNGKIFITGQFIPATVRSALKSGGLNPSSLNNGVDAEVKDGVIRNISNKQIGVVTREALEGVYQPNMDKEPLKGSHLKFGNGQKKTWKHSATGAGGKKAYSDDGINWFDENGNPIK